MSTAATRINLPIQRVETALAGSQDLLRRVQQKFGFVPNLLGVMANAPALLEGYLALAGIFEKTSLSATERQIVLLAASFENGCDYCMAAHTVIAGMQQVEPSIVRALRENLPVEDERLEALRLFAAEVAATRCRPSAESLDQFLQSGYSPEQALEVILGVGVKTLSNYTNHLAGTPLDRMFDEAKWSAPDDEQSEA